MQGSDYILKKLGYLSHVLKGHAASNTMRLVISRPDNQPRCPVQEPKKGKKEYWHLLAKRVLTYKREAQGFDVSICSAERETSRYSTPIHAYGSDHWTLFESTSVDKKIIFYYALGWNFVTILVSSLEF